MSVFRGLVAMKLMEEMTIDERIDFIDRNMQNASAKDKMALLAKVTLQTPEAATVEKTAMMNEKSKDVIIPSKVSAYEVISKKAPKTEHATQDKKNIGEGSAPLSSSSSSPCSTQPPKKRGRKRKIDLCTAEVTKTPIKESATRETEANVREEIEQPESIPEQQESKDDTKKELKVAHQAASENGNSEPDATSLHFRKSSARVPLRSRCPRVSRDVIFAALKRGDIDTMTRVARSMPNALDERGRVRTQSLRDAVNTRADWVDAVHRMHARRLYAEVIEQRDIVCDDDE